MRRVLERLQTRWSWIQFGVDHVGWILVSLSLALLIWVVASLDENPIQQRELTDPVAIEFLDASEDGVVLLNSATLRRTASIMIRAPRGSWEAEDEDDRLKRSDIELWADLRDLEPGTHTVELHARIVEDGPRGRVVGVSPSEILVEMVPLQAVAMPVEFLEVSALPDDFQYIRNGCDADEVNIQGPNVVVQDLARAEVRLNLRRPDEDVWHVGEVVLLDSGGRELTTRELESLTIVPDQIGCQVIVSQIANSKKLRVAPVVTGAPPTGYFIESTETQPEEVTVVGDRDQLELLVGDSVQTEPINITGQTSEFSRTVALELPEGIRLLDENTRITVTVHIRPIVTTRQFAEVPVQLVNLAATFSASVVPQTVIVTVDGPEPLIRDLTLEDLSVTVDVLALGEGTHTALPAVVLVLREAVRDVATVSVQPQTVEVVISLLPTSTPQPGDTPLPPATAGPPQRLFGKFSSH